MTGGGEDEVEGERDKQHGGDEPAAAHEFDEFHSPHPLTAL